MRIWSFREVTNSPMATELICVRTRIWTCACLTLPPKLVTDGKALGHKGRIPEPLFAHCSQRKAPRYLAKTSQGSLRVLSFWVWWEWTMYKLSKDHPPTHNLEDSSNVVPLEEVRAWLQDPAEVSISRSPGPHRDKSLSNCMLCLLLSLPRSHFSQIFPRLAQPPAFGHLK